MLCEENVCSLAGETHSHTSVIRLSVLVTSTSGSYQNKVTRQRPYYNVHYAGLLKFILVDSRNKIWYFGRQFERVDFFLNYDCLSIIQVHYIVC